MLRVFIYLECSPLRTSVTLLEIRVFRSSMLLPCSSVDNRKYIPASPGADDPKMAQVEDLSSGGCEADHDWVKTDLKSAGNSAFSRCERSFFLPMFEDFNI